MLNANAGGVIAVLKFYDQSFENHLLLGTAGYPSLEILCQAIQASGAEIITVALRRQLNDQSGNNEFWERIKRLDCQLLPNTAGCHQARDAITTAEMAREIFNTDWIKLEVIGDDYNLQPDVIELVKAAGELVQRGFKVFPYCTDDLVVCQRLLDAGCEVLMPWAAPIGSGRGIMNPYALTALRARFPNVTLVVDAGIGKPSDAVQAMELGYDAVLVNTAVASAGNPVMMARAFKNAVASGWQAYRAGCIPKRNQAVPSTPVLDTPFWSQYEKNE